MFDDVNLSGSHSGRSIQINPRDVVVGQRSGRKAYS
jgi:hypothetical protein